VYVAGPVKRLVKARAVKRGKRGDLGEKYAPEFDVALRVTETDSARKDSWGELEGQRKGEEKVEGE